MSLSLDKALGIHPRAIALRAERTELLASNLANADTPHYKARDIDYRAVLSALANPGATLALTRTQARHLPTPRSSAEAPEAAPLYRVPAQPALDGNTVDPQLEHAAFAENALQFQTSLEFLDRKISSLRTAMRQE